MRKHDVYLALQYLSAAALLLPFSMGIYRKVYLNSSAKSIFYLILCNLPVEVISIVLHAKGVNNFKVMRVFTVIEFGLLSWFYFETLKAHRLAPYVKGLIFLFAGVAIYDYLKDNPNNMDTLPMTVESLILIAYALFTFYYLLEKRVYSNILKAPVFAFNLGVLVYFSGCLFLFIVGNFLLVLNSEMRNGLWLIHSLLNITFSIFITKGFWKTRTS
jgi:hypothetical protein